MGSEEISAGNTFAARRFSVERVRVCGGAFHTFSVHVFGEQLRRFSVPFTILVFGQQSLVRLCSVRTKKLHDFGPNFGFS